MSKYTNINLLRDLKENISKVNYPPNYRDDHDFYQYANDTNFGFGSGKRVFNCYAYALQFNVDLYRSIYYKNLMRDFIRYCPGFLTDDVPDFYCEENLVKLFFSDLDVLGIKFSDCNLEDDVTSDSYKVIIMLEKKLIYKDFHFIRQNSDGSWSEKEGYYGNVKIVNPDEKIKRYNLIHTVKLKKN